MHQALRDDLGLAQCLEGLGDICAAQGQVAAAARLFAAAGARRQALGAPVPPAERARYDGSMALVRAGLGPAAFTTESDAGCTMTIEALVAVSALVTPRRLPRPTPVAPARLTPREVEILHLVAQGLTNKAIAARLVISPRTVYTHLTSIYGKLGVASRSAATRFAVEHHLA